MNPLKYRPEQDEDDWEDNWLSNAMAFFSLTLFPNLCKRGWAVDLAIHLWAECSCCLLFRGITLGVLFGLPVGVLIGVFI